MTKVHLIGNAHIDPVWLWRWTEGFSEIKATFRSALDRINEYPDFVFTCACAAYYKWVEENCPEMFEEIRQRVAEGRWVVVGGMWIQPDCNIPSGESFARHFLYSQQYFKQKLGVTAKVGYNVDSFGHNGMLPQLLKKGGMDYYVFMRPDKAENRDIPGVLFQWESEDGSRVLAFRIPTSYSSWWGDPSSETSLFQQKINESVKIISEQGFDNMEFFGVGNHGGGPTIENIESIHKLQKEPQPYTVVMSSPDKFFEEIEKQNPELPIWKNDLQHHASGCYSTMSEVKASNRKVEHRLVTAEKFMTMAHAIAGLQYRGDKVFEAWENVMFNHFHDIMGGCSIKEAYEDVREAYGESLHTGAEILNAAMQKISWSIDTSKGEDVIRSKEKDWNIWESGDKGAPVVVFNPLPWLVKAPVQLNKLIKGVTDDEGAPVVIQKVRGSQTNRDDKWNSLFMAEIPAMGYRVYWMYKEKEYAITSGEGTLSASGNTLENDYLKLDIELYTGYIKELLDKTNCTQVFTGAGAVPVVIDIEHCDTWAHRIFQFDREIARFSDAEVTLVENGPVRAKLRVTSRYNDSSIRQDFILYRDKAYVEVQVKLDWREKHKMLKLSFPVNVKEAEVTYEIPYGFIKRPANGEEEPGQQWVDVTGLCNRARYGLSVINDSKYSYDVKDNDLRLTIANSSIYADHFANYFEQNRDELCEFMDQGVQEFKYVICPHAGSFQEAGTIRKAYELNVQPVHINETYHKGNLPVKMAGISVSTENVIASVLKMAEDGQGYILRCYETSGRTAETEIELPFISRKWSALFKGCEIKTFRIPLDPKMPVVENDLIEMGASKL